MGMDECLMEQEKKHQAASQPPVTTSPTPFFRLIFGSLPLSIIAQFVPNLSIRCGVDFQLHEPT